MTDQNETPVDEIVRLDTIGCGAALELFDIELGRVLENIADVNTEAEAKRTITLTVKIKPNKMREAGEIEIACESKLAPARPADAVLFFGKRGGRRIAVEHDPRQMGMFDKHDRPTVVPMPQAAKGGTEQ